jgi:hypothetical protein
VARDLGIDHSPFSSVLKWHTTCLIIPETGPSSFIAAAQVLPPTADERGLILFVDDDPDHADTADTVR